MREQSFTLIPFPDPKTPDIQITGKITREENYLAIHYSLAGEVEKILFPESCSSRTRKDELWKSTCFEFFLALPDESQYWEFNISPTGDWNVYHMEAYRRVGFREETSIQQLRFSVQKEMGCVDVDTSVDLTPIIRAESRIQVGLTSVIQTKDNHESYWALVHLDLQADFHIRDSFTIELS